MNATRTAVLAFVLVLAIPAAAFAQQQCPASSCRQNVTREDEHWPAGAEVNVFISNAFSYAEQVTIAQAFQSWASIAQQNGITYNIQFGIPATTAGISFPHTVERRAPVGAIGSSGETASPNALYGEAFEWAVTNIDPHVTDLNALRALMVHEIGHTMGLTDCADCCPGSTVMLGNRPDPNEPWHADYNNSQGMPQSPTGCDMQNSVQRIAQDAETDDETTPSGGDADTRLVDNTSPGGGGVSCYVEYTYSCNYNYTDCYILSYRYLGCW